MRFFNLDKSVKNMLAIVVSFISVIVITSSVYNQTAKNIINNEVLKLAENDSGNMGKSFERTINEIDQITRFLLINAYVSNYIISGETEIGTGNMKPEMKNIISSYRYVYDYIESIYIYSEAAEDMFFNGSNQVLLSVGDSDWKEIYDNCENSSLQIRAQYGSFPIIYTFVRKININGNVGGIIVNVDVNRLSGILGDVDADNQKKYIIDNTGRILYKYSIRNIDDNVGNYLEYRTDKENYIYSKSGYMYAVSMYKCDEFDYRCIVENKIDSKPLKNVRNVTIIIILVLSVFAIFAAFHINRMTYKPIKTLAKLFDLSVDERKEIKFDDSNVERIASKFIHEMSVNDELREELIKQMKSVDELKRYAFGIQINPHFISSTLNLVHLKLMEEYGIDYKGCEILQDCAKCVQRIVRNNNDMVTIRDEIEYTELYAEILREKSNNDVKIEIIVENDVSLDAKIIKLSLNTMIENAFYHGISSKSEPVGRILCHIKKRDNMLSCSVSDDGVGMYEDELEELRERIATSDSVKNANIGLINIQSRIKLILGGEYGIRIDSIRGEGTTVTVDIPYII